MNGLECNGLPLRFCWSLYLSYSTVSAVVVVDVGTIVLLIIMDNMEVDIHEVVDITAMAAVETVVLAWICFGVCVVLNGVVGIVKMSMIVAERQVDRVCIKEVKWCN